MSSDTRLAERPRCHCTVCHKHEDCLEKPSRDLGPTFIQNSYRFFQFPHSKTLNAHGPYLCTGLEYGIEFTDTVRLISGPVASCPQAACACVQYADDLVLICPDPVAAQTALDLVQEWAVDFGMTIGVGQGETEAMYVSAATKEGLCR